jgi:hypothetical protein
LGQRVEQGGFAGVGIAHHRDRRQIGLAPRPPPLLALAFDPIQPQADLPDAIGQQPAVGL